MIPFPAPDEYAEFHQGYLSAVANESDALSTLTRQQRTIEAMRRLTPEQAGSRYADGKWSVRAVIGHLTDTERVLSYRLLRIARGDAAALPGFNENTVAAHSNADDRALGELVEELSLVRASTLALARSLDETALTRRGTVNNWTLTTRAVAFIIAGHFQHHVNVLRDRYEVDLGE